MPREKKLALPVAGLSTRLGNHCSLCRGFSGAKGWFRRRIVQPGMFSFIRRLLDRQRRPAGLRRREGGRSVGAGGGCRSSSQRTRPRPQRMLRVRPRAGDPTPACQECARPAARCARRCLEWGISGRIPRDPDRFDMDVWERMPPFGVDKANGRIGGAQVNAEAVVGARRRIRTGRRIPRGDVVVIHNDGGGCGMRPCARVARGRRGGRRPHG